MTGIARGVRLHPAVLLVLLSGLILAGCREPPTSQVDPVENDDCLEEIRLDELAEAIRRCDAVVAAHPLDPRPWSDRSLLHSLAGDQKAACQDIERAAVLLGTASEAVPPDRQLRIDIRVRQESCREPPAKATD